MSVKEEEISQNLMALNEMVTTVVMHWTLTFSSSGGVQGWPGLYFHRLPQKLSP
jgi:hypothetical protein